MEFSNYDQTDSKWNKKYYISFRTTALLRLFVFGPQIISRILVRQNLCLTKSLTLDNSRSYVDSNINV